MEKFSKAIAKEISEKVQEVLRSHYEDDTLEFFVNGGSLSSDKLTLHLDIRMKDAAGALVIDEEKHIIADNAIKRAGLEFTGHILGSKWLVKGDIYEVVDYIGRRPKYPIRLRRCDGAISKCSMGFLKSGAQITKPTCTEFTTWCVVDPESDAVRESDVEVCDRVADYMDATYPSDKVEVLCNYINYLLDMKKAKQYASYIYCELDGGIDRAIKFAKDAYKKESDKVAKPKNVRKKKRA